MGDDASPGNMRFLQIARPSPRNGRMKSRTTTTTSPSQPWFRRVDGFKASRLRALGFEASSYPEEEPTSQKVDHQALTQRPCSPYQAAVRHAEGAPAFLTPPSSRDRPLRMCKPRRTSRSSVLREGRPAKRLSAVACRPCTTGESCASTAPRGTTGTPSHPLTRRQDSPTGPSHSHACYETAGITNRDRIHITPGLRPVDGGIGFQLAPSAWAP